VQWYGPWHGGWMWGMHIAWWGIWLVVVAVFWWALVWVGASSGGPQASESPADILRRRYAEGALTTAEFEERMAKLAGTIGH
jgi:putative membrane protein